MHFLNLQRYALNPKFPKICVFHFQIVNLFSDFGHFYTPKNVQNRKSFYRFGNFFHVFYMLYVFLYLKKIYYIKTT